MKPEIGDNTVLFVKFKKYGGGWVVEVEGSSPKKQLIEAVSEEFTLQFQPAIWKGKPGVICFPLTEVAAPVLEDK